MVTLVDVCLARTTADSRGRTEQLTLELEQIWPTIAAADHSYIPVTTYGRRSGTTRRRSYARTRSMIFTCRSWCIRILVLLCNTC